MQRFEDAQAIWTLLFALLHPCLRIDCTCSYCSVASGTGATFLIAEHELLKSWEGMGRRTYCVSAGLSCNIRCNLPPLFSIARLSDANADRIVVFGMSGALCPVPEGMPYSVWYTHSNVVQEVAQEPAFNNNSTAGRRQEEAHNASGSGNGSLPNPVKPEHGPHREDAEDMDEGRASGMRGHLEDRHQLPPSGLAEDVIDILSDNDEDVDMPQSGTAGELQAPCHSA